MPSPRPRRPSTRRTVFRSMVRLAALSILCLTRLGAGEALLFEHVRITVGDPAHRRVIEDGAVLIRDGLIERVGTVEGSGEADALPAPPGARRVDATGLHAYPAFIDAATSAGLTKSPPEALNEGRTPDFGDGPTPRTRRGHRSGITPERSAIELWSADDASLEGFRKNGFGAVHALPSGGFLAGRGAVLSLARRPLRELVIRESTGQSASFSSRFSGYPRSLMGVVAHLRQTFLDARHHAQWAAFYRENPRGVPRPPRDSALRAVHALLNREAPILFQADSDNDIRRALRLSAEFGLRTMIVGGRDATLALDPLRDRSVRAVLLTADPGEAPEIELKVGQPPPRVQEEGLERWRRRARTAQALEDRGIPFAFGSGAQKDPAKLLTAVRTAIAEGLDEITALRQLTLGAAEILGVDAVLGSIDSGKIASVVLLTAPFRDEKARVRYLVVDGDLLDYEPPKDEKKDEKGEDEKKKDTPPKEEEKPGDPPEGMVLEAELDSDRRPSLRTGGDLFIRDGTVITLAGTTLEKASIRIRGGKIEAIGPDVGADGIAQVIDARGWFVSPGIIDCHSHIAIEGGVNESTETITCQVRIGDVVDPHDVSIYRALAGGTTAAHLLHGSANVMGGQCQLIKLKYGRPAEELKFDGVPPTVKFALGENVKRSNSPTRADRFPVTRMGVEASLRRAFAAAADYGETWKRYAADRARGQRVLEPRRDLRLEALLKVLRGEILVHCHSYRADEILMLIGVAEEFDFRVRTFQHVLEGYKVAPEIAAHGAGASTFSDWWAYKFEVIDAIPYNGALMTRAGIVVSFNSDSDELIRHLNHEAAKGVKYGGLQPDEALKLVTLHPARQLRVDNRIGSIEAGKDADLAIFDAHPLSVYARCRYTIIDGEVYFERGGERENPLARRPLSGPEDILPGEVTVHPEGIYAIRGARIVPIDGSPIDRGSVVIREGKIAALGRIERVEIPAGATVINADGLEIYPGMIDAGSRLGLVEINSVRGSVDLGETGSSHPDLRMAVAVNAHSDLIPVARVNGITAAAVFNDTRGLIAGQAGVIQLDGMSTPEAVLEDSWALQVNVRRSSRGSSREGEEPEWVKTFEDWVERARRHAEAGGSVPRDTRLEALAPFVKGERPVCFTADGEANIRLAVELAARLDLRAIIRGGRDAWKLATLLKEKGIPVIVGPVLSVPGERHDPYDAPYANPGRLHAAGVSFAFQSDDESSCRNLPYDVGTAVAFGLPREAALRAVTLGAAEILGIADRTGSLTVGKRADLIVTDGDPFEMRTHIRHLFIAGKPISLETRHTRLYRKFRERIGKRKSAKQF